MHNSSKIRIPSWNEEFPNLNTATTDQKKFYEYWISETKNSNFIDLKDNLSYLYAYLYSLIYDFIKDEDIEFLSIQFDRIMDGYGHISSVRKYLIDWKADAYLLLGNYEKSLEIRKEIGFNSHNIKVYGILKEDTLITGEVLVNLKSGYNSLTSFGKKNKSKIAEIIDVYLNEFVELYGKNIVRHFLEDYNLNSLTKTDLDELKRCFEYEKDFQEIIQYYNPNSPDKRQHIPLNYFKTKNLSNKNLLRLKNNLNKEIYSKITDFRGDYQYTEYNVNISEINSNKLKLWKTILAKSDFLKLNEEYKAYLKNGYGNFISIDLDMDRVLEDYDFKELDKLEPIIDYIGLKLYIRSIINLSSTPKGVIVNNLFPGVPKILRIDSYTTNVPYIVIKALENEIKRIIRESENIHRQEKNIPQVGEGWVSETELYYKIKDSFPKEIIIPHGRPKWLGKQHLDIYFPKKKIGIEYQGFQHNNAVDFFGGEEGLTYRKELDERKSRLCKDNNCKLIYVYPEYDFEEVLNKIKNCL